MILYNWMRGKDDEHATDEGVCSSAEPAWGVAGFKVGEEGKAVGASPSPDLYGQGAEFSQHWAYTGSLGSVGVLGMFSE